MKPLIHRVLSLFLVGSLFLAARSAYAQTKKPAGSFPAFDELKQNNKELIDFGSPNQHFTLEKSPINLFDHPKGTVTYVVNGKAYKKEKQVKRLLSNKHIESVSIGKLDEQGYRTIKIDYELPVKNGEYGVVTLQFNSGGQFKIPERSGK